MPMNRNLYPDNWVEISTGVKEAADWKCLECGKQCRRPGEPMQNDGEDWSRTLTTAHLNHKQWDCRPENLRALCAPCHQDNDASHNQKKRWSWIRFQEGILNGVLRQAHMFASVIRPVPVPDYSDRRKPEPKREYGPPRLVWSNGRPVRQSGQVVAIPVQNPDIEIEKGDDSVA